MRDDLVVSPWAVAQARLERAELAADTLREALASFAQRGNWHVSSVLHWEKYAEQSWQQVRRATALWIGKAEHPWEQAREALECWPEREATACEQTHH